MTKVPHQLHEIAAELNLDLAGEHEETEDLEQLIAWVRDEVSEARAEANRHYDEMEGELDDIDIEELTKEEHAS